MSNIYFNPSPDNPHTSAPDGHTLSFGELKNIYQTLIANEDKAQAAHAAEAHRDEALPLLKLNMLAAAITFVACAGTFGLEVTGGMNELLAPAGLRMSSDFQIVTYPVLLSMGIYSILTLINSARAYHFMDVYYKNHASQTHQRRAPTGEE